MAKLDWQKARPVRDARDDNQLPPELARLLHGDKPPPVRKSRASLRQEAEDALAALKAQGRTVTACPAQALKAGPGGRAFNPRRRGRR